MSEVATQRIDQYLWRARFFKSRTLAAATLKKGHTRINGKTRARAASTVRVGDRLTFMTGSRVRIIEITALPTRRGPAPEAQSTYKDLTPELEKTTFRNKAQTHVPRPNKKQRRALVKLKEKQQAIE